MAIDSRTPESDADGVSRRTVIRGAAVAGAAAVTGLGLTACSDDSSNGGGSGSAANTAQNTAPSTGTSAGSDATTGAAGGGGGGAAGGQALARTSEIPVGGGKVIDKKIVITQPSAGKFEAFSAICTHNGCPVNRVENNTIKCPCHQSQFSAVDGSVKGGPAPAPLAKINITVQGDSIVQA
jgi:Rieske Fe-S protein